MSQDGNTSERGSEQLTPVAAAGSALAALVCCLPTCFGATAGTTGVLLALSTAQPWLLALSAVLLGAGWCGLRRARGTSPKRRQRTVAFLWFSAMVVTLLIVDWLL